MMSFMMGVVFARKEGLCRFAFCCNPERDARLVVVAEGEKEGELKGKRDVLTHKQRTH